MSLLLLFGLLFGLLLQCHRRWPCDSSRGCHWPCTARADSTCDRLSINGLRCTTGCTCKVGSNLRRSERAYRSYGAECHHRTHDLSSVDASIHGCAGTLMTSTPSGFARRRVAAILIHILCRTTAHYRVGAMCRTSAIPCVGAAASRAESHSAQCISIEQTDMDRRIGPGVRASIHRYKRRHCRLADAHPSASACSARFCRQSRYARIVHSSTRLASEYKYHDARRAR
jgi:hypothetical protein